MNTPNTHSAYIVGKDFSAFIDGIPDECDHVWKGATVFRTASGKVIHWHTFRQLASYTSMARDPLIIQHQINECDPVVEAASTCSKCGKVFHPDILSI